MSNEVCLYLYVSDFCKLFIYCWTMSTFFRVMGLPLSWSVDNHSSTNNDSDMNMKNILSFQRKMDMKLAFYIFLWVFFSSSSCILWEYVWQTPFLLHNFNPFFMKEILPFWLFGLIPPWRKKTIRLLLFSGLWLLLLETMTRRRNLCWNVTFAPEWTMSVVTLQTSGLRLHGHQREIQSQNWITKLYHFSPRISETCIVATGDNGDITRMCGRKDEYVPKCVNDDTFCFCTVGKECSLPASLTVFLLSGQPL